jgi:tetratricopeptide (TPR) repeat protein
MSSTAPASKARAPAGRFLIVLTAALPLAGTGCVELGRPWWSPDGRKIVYTRLVGRAPPEVWLVDLDRAEPPRRVAEKGFRASWSPGGDRVFFLAPSEGPGYGGVHLRSCLPDGSGVRDHVSGPGRRVTWYALDPSGRAVYYVRADTGQLFLLDLGTGRATALLPEGERCAGAALEPAGRLLACAVEAENKRGEAGYKVRLLDLGEGEPRSTMLQGEGGGTLEAFVPRPAKPGETWPVTVTMLYRPPGGELIVLTQHCERIHVLPLRRGRERSFAPARPGGVVLAGASPDGTSLHLTVDTGSAEGPRFLPQRVDLRTGRSEVVGEPSDHLVGGRSWRPGGGAACEMTPAGLRVWALDGDWDILYPADASEYARAAAAELSRARPAEALEYIRLALEKPGPGADAQRLFLLESDARLALGERREAATALLEGWLLHPVSDVPVAEVDRRMRALRGEDRLVEACLRALGEEGDEKAVALARAMPLAADPRLLAGLAFRTGEADLASGDHQEAGRRFREASEVAGFPAGDYAAALAGCAHYVSGRRDRYVYAKELMLKAIDHFPASPLQDDFRAALSFMTENSGSLIRRLNDVDHPSGAVAWVKVLSTRSVRWSLGPDLVDGRGGRRRLLLESDERYSLHLARPDRRARAVLKGVPRALGGLAFSPSGELLAFLAEADDGASAPFVVDLDGKVILGDGDALSSDVFLGGMGEVTDLAWDPAGRALLVRVAPEVEGGRPEVKRIELPEREITEEGNG